MMKMKSQILYLQTFILVGKIEYMMTKTKKPSEATVNTPCFLNAMAFLVAALAAVTCSVYSRSASTPVILSDQAQKIPFTYVSDVKSNVEKLPVYHRRSNLYNSSAFDHCDVDGTGTSMTDCMKEVMLQNNREINGELDPSLIPMPYSIYKSDGSVEYGQTLVYKRPPMSTFYPDFPNKSEIIQKTPRFNGFAAKFFNLSPWPVKLYW